MEILGITLSQSQLWLLGVAGVCAAWLVNHKLTISRNERDRKAVAKQAFRTAILTELAAIYPIPSGWPDSDRDLDTFLKSKFPALQAAVSAFHPFVADKDRFDAAWLRYHNAYPNQQQGEWYHHYWGSYDPTTGTQELAHKKAQSLFRNNVQQLLSFAEDA